jgi:choline dehydrogenase-like flavoprotein
LTERAFPNEVLADDGYNVLLGMTYDLILVGTGFASSFFLLEYLRRSPATSRVLVVERGWREARAWQLEMQRVSRIVPETTYRREGMKEKEWKFTLAFGGGSNCWFGCTPRLMPNDFRMKRAFGVGDDWPLRYEDLEPYYEEAERVMAIAGSPDRSPYPRRGPHPQPPHRLSDPDRLLVNAYPEHYFPQPTARARVPVGRRSACCANGVCGLCPIDAKFTIENGLSELYDDPRVTTLFGSTVKAVDVANNHAAGLVVEREGREDIVSGDLVVLGAGGLFNAAVLLRSNVPHRLLGTRLFEQLSVSADVDLAGVDNFQGSTVFTGHGYMLYDGPHRASHAGCLIESWNRPDQLRWERGRERQFLHLKFLVEDLPQARNAIVLGRDGLPTLRFHDYDAYAYRGIEAIADRLEPLLAPLPVERVAFNPEPETTEGHLLGTVVMGDDPATSVVDKWMVHHRIRNLAVIGGSAFPTGSPSNPTLTISALALWSAAHLTSRQ